MYKSCLDCRMPKMATLLPNGNKDWWKSNCEILPAFTYVLRAVLTSSPNSCPSERLFSIFNTTYNDDRKKSHTDYIELSMQTLNT
jgi:hypothetical protein